MPRILRVRLLMLPILVLFFVVAWSSHPPQLRAETGVETPNASHQAAKAAEQSLDACTFIPKAELEKLVGRELRDGVKKEGAAPMSQCSFQTPPDAYVTRKFDSPALPPASGFDSLTVTTFPTTVATFAESRKTMGGSSPVISGVGDEAFLSGPAMIFARVGIRGFSIRVYVNAPTTDAGRARLHEIMLTLARAGVPKLKSWRVPTWNIGG